MSLIYTWSCTSVVSITVVYLFVCLFLPIGLCVRRVFELMLGAMIAYLSIPVVQNLLSSRQAMNTSFDSFRTVNTYGAFGRYLQSNTLTSFKTKYRFLFCIFKLFQISNFFLTIYLQGIQRFTIAETQQAQFRPQNRVLLASTAHHEL